MQLDQIHGRHRQPGAVDHAADIARQRDVIQPRCLRSHFLVVYLRIVTHVSELLLPSERVVVHAHFAVQRHHAPIGGNHQRIDFQQAQVGVGEKLVQCAQHAGEITDMTAAKPQAKRQIAALKFLQTQQRIA